MKALIWELIKLAIRTYMCIIPFSVKKRENKTLYTELITHSNKYYEKVEDESSNSEILETCNSVKQELEGNRNTKHEGQY